MSCLKQTLVNINSSTDIGGEIAYMQDLKTNVQLILAFTQIIQVIWTAHLYELRFYQQANFSS